MIRTLLAPLIAATALSACSYGYDRPAFDVPVAQSSFAARPAIPVPADNAPTPARVELGRRLFFDTALSASGDMSCATCHDPARAFTDGRPRAVGSAGRVLVRNTPTIINAAYSVPQFWDGRARGLEDQAFRPVVNGAEMAMHPGTAVAVVAGNADYRIAFSRAYPGEAISERSIARALASYQRSIVSGTAPFDRWLAGDRGAISDSAARGFAVFTGAGDCAACHSGWRFSDDRFHDIGRSDSDLGRGGVTNNRAFDHAFKTPSLREVALTAPYFHDGSAATLDEVVDHYADTSHRRAGALRPISLSPGQRADLVAFLRSLTSDAPVQP